MWCKVALVRKQITWCDCKKGYEAESENYIETALLCIL